jgi:uncharacterized Zn-binding protein involved in type VI secretion
MSGVGDIAIGTCCCHDGCDDWVGIIMSGAGRSNCENRQIARIGDIVVGCHTATIVTGSSNFLVENQPASGIGDIVVGCPIGIIVTGFSKSNIP